MPESAKEHIYEVYNVAWQLKLDAYPEQFKKYKKKERFNNKNNDEYFITNIFAKIRIIKYNK